MLEANHPPTHARVLLIHLLFYPFHLVLSCLLPEKKSPCFRRWMTIFPALTLFLLNVQTRSMELFFKIFDIFSVTKHLD